MSNFILTYKNPREHLYLSINKYLILKEKNISKNTIKKIFNKAIIDEIKDSKFNNKVEDCKIIIYELNSNINHVLISTNIYNISNDILFKFTDNSKRKKFDLKLNNQLKKIFNESIIKYYKVKIKYFDYSYRYNNKNFVDELVNKQNLISHKKKKNIKFFEKYIILDYTFLITIFLIVLILIN